MNPNHKKLLSAQLGLGHFALGLFLSLSCLLLTTSCSKSSTKDIKTEDLAVLYKVEDSGVKITCSAEFFRKGEGSSLELGESDAVVCNNNPMKIESTDTGPKYVTAVTKDSAGKVTITFSRSDEVPYLSTTGVPQAVQLSQSIADVYQDSPLRVDWDALTTDRNWVTARLTVLHPKQPRDPQIVEDGPPESGTLVFSGAILSSEPYGTGVWDATVDISRNESGDLSPSLAGEITGSFKSFYRLKILPR